MRSNERKCRKEETAQPGLPALDSPAIACAAIDCASVGVPALAVVANSDRMRLRRRKAER